MDIVLTLFCRLLIYFICFIVSFLKKLNKEKMINDLKSDERESIINKIQVPHLNNHCGGIIIEQALE